MQLIEIDKEDIIEHLSVLQKEDSEMYDLYEELKRAVRLMPTVDAVPAKEVDALERRLKHLLKSDYIRQYDEKILRSGEYKLDIRDADKHKYKRIADQFAADCISGKRIVGKEIVDACIRYQNDLKRTDLEYRGHDPEFLITVMERTLVFSQGVLMK